MHSFTHNNQVFALTQIKQSFSACCLVPTYAAIVSVKEKAAFFSFSEENDFESQFIPMQNTLPSCLIGC